MLTTRMLRGLVIPLMAAMAFQSLVAGDSAVAPPASKAAAKSSKKPAAKPALPAAVPKSPVTISITSSMRQGNLVVSVDDVPVFSEEFRKPVYLISQTTTWDPVPVPAGKHKLTAKVHGKNGKTYLSEIYNLELSRTKGIELRIRVKGGRLTVESAS